MFEHFILSGDGPLLRLPRCVIEQLMNHRARLPQYAGMKVPCAQVQMDIDEAGQGNAPSPKDPVFVPRSTNTSENGQRATQRRVACTDELQRTRKSPPPCARMARRPR